MALLPMCSERYSLCVLCLFAGCALTSMPCPSYNNQVRQAVMTTEDIGASANAMR